MSTAVITAVMQHVAMAGVAYYKPVSQMLPVVKDYGTKVLNANTPRHMFVCRVM